MVLGQLFMTQHTVSVDYVNDRVLRTNPHLLLVQSHHAVLGTKQTVVWNLFWDLDFIFLSLFHRSKNYSQVYKTLENKAVIIFQSTRWHHIHFTVAKTKLSERTVCYLKIPNMEKDILSAVSLNREWKAFIKDIWYCCQLLVYHL